MAAGNEVNHPRIWWCTARLGLGAILETERQGYIQHVAMLLWQANV